MEPYEITHTLLKSPEFLKLWRESSHRYISWDEFKHFNMPEGYSVKDVWEVIVVLRRYSGYTLPFVSYLPTASGAELVWFSVPHETQILLQDISERTKETSQLSSTIIQRDSRYFQIHLMLTEVLSVLQRDGINIDLGRATSLCFGNTEPVLPGEKVFVRLCNTFYDACKYFKKRISRGTVENLYDALWDDDEVIFEGVTRLDRTVNQEYFTTDYVLNTVCELSNLSLSNSLIHPVIAGLNIAGLMWDHKPLPQLNASIALLILRILYYKSNYPALAYLPFSRSCYEWEQGNYDEDAGLPLFQTTLETEDCGQGLDSTSFHSSVLKLFENELGKLQGRVEAFVSREHKRYERLVHSTDFNQRQKNIMSEALKNLLFSTSINEYCKTYKVAYSTGRKDLLDLVERGYFSCKKVGFAFSFSVGQGIGVFLQAE